MLTVQLLNSQFPTPQLPIPNSSLPIPNSPLPTPHSFPTPHPNSQTVARSLCSLSGRGALPGGGQARSARAVSPPNAPFPTPKRHCTLALLAIRTGALPGGGQREARVQCHLPTPHSQLPNGIARSLCSLSGRGALPGGGQARSARAVSPPNAPSPNSQTAFGTLALLAIRTGALPGGGQARSARAVSPPTPQSHSETALHARFARYPEGALRDGRKARERASTGVWELGVWELGVWELGVGRWALGSWALGVGELGRQAADYNGEHS